MARKRIRVEKKRTRTTSIAHSMRYARAAVLTAQLVPGQEIAKRLGVYKQQVSRWRREPAFKKAVEDEFRRISEETRFSHCAVLKYRDECTVASYRWAVSIVRSERTTFKEKKDAATIIAALNRSISSRLNATADTPHEPNPEYL